jgi:hypothetical protein
VLLQHPAVVVAAAALTLAACKGGRHGGAAAGGVVAGVMDAAADARAAAPVAEASVDPTAPPDDAIPPTSSDELTARSRHLLEAVTKDDATLAGDILFPRDGWLATRDAPDPGHDWEKRAAGPFRRTIHALSRRRKDAASAQFVSIELGHAMRQVTPQRHGWKKVLWSVTGSRVTFVVDGRTRTLAIHEMTAWRGAWYVTRL